MYTLFKYKQFYILNSFKGDFWSCVACFSILLDLDSFDDFFNFLSTGSFVHTEIMQPLFQHLISLLVTLKIVQVEQN